MTDPYRWIDPWEEINEAHHAGYASGHYEGYQEGYEDGRNYSEPYPAADEVGIAHDR